MNFAPGFPTGTFIIVLWRVSAPKSESLTGTVPKVSIITMSL
ncbi:MAG: hypothetical protein R2812_06600 [Gelidibacter sp.]